MIPELTARLAGLAALNQTTSYGALARDLNLTGPATIARLTAELEQLMEQDCGAGLPLRAALLCQRGSNLPAQGFFDKAAALGYIIPDPTEFTADQRQALHLHLGSNTSTWVWGCETPSPTSHPKPTGPLE